MINEPDHYYIKKTLNGDTNAFSFLVKRYENMVFTIALKMMHNREEAEDVAQEAFIKSFKALKRFKGDAKFSTWLYRISYNHCLDKIKEKKRFVHPENIDEFNNAELDIDSDILSVIEAKERSVIIEEALKKLKNEEQLIMTLYYFEEQSIKEIGKVLGINPNNVKIKLYRSRNKLVSLLKHSTELLN